SSLAGWNNTSKNYDGQLEGFSRNGVLDFKRREEAAVLDWLRTRGDAGKPALAAHAALVKLIEDGKRTQERDLVLGSFNRTGLLGTAVNLYRLAIEKQKPDAERESGYQERSLPMIEGSLKQMERRYAPAMDRQLQQYWLDRYLALPAAQHVAAVDAWLGGSDTSIAGQALDRLAGSKLRSLDESLQWFKNDRATLEASTVHTIKYTMAEMPT